MSKQGLLDGIQIPKTRKSILTALKEQGNLTADQLAEQLGISTVAVRRHLDNLKRDDLINYDEVQRGLGRPSFVYSLSAKGHSLFPQDYQGLAEDMVFILKSTYGDDMLTRVFEERGRRILENYRPHITGKTLAQRIEQLVALREADGYMASWQTLDDGNFLLSEQNCPIHQVAEACGQACHEDLRLFSNLLQAEVVRVDHLLRGDSSCSYVVKPR